MIELTIDGMTCDHCARNIEKTIKRLSPVYAVSVNYTTKRANIEHNDEIQSEKIISAIQALGYKVIELGEKPSAFSPGESVHQAGSMSNDATPVADESQHIVIIGSGSAAFSCAIKATENDARVTIIEANDKIGGCCVNIGCVPSKILIRAAQLAQQQRNNPFSGLENTSPQINRQLLAQQQSARVDELRAAKYESILANNEQISLLKGFASFIDDSSIKVVANNDSEQVLKADKFLIATGSKATIPNIDGLDKTPYWTSTDALFNEILPKHLVVIGSSVVALELAQAYRRLGSDVTIIARHTLLYREDPLVGEHLQAYFEKEGIKVLTHSQANSVHYSESGFVIKLEDGQTISADQLLISTGRQANTDKLNLSATGVERDHNGSVIVNERMQTSCSHIYAAGDCSTMPQFVYVAAAAGNKAAMNMTGGVAELDLSAMPAVIFTDPQVATVGMSEVQAMKKGIQTDSRVLTMDNVPRALANFATDGFIKLVINKDNEQIIGAQILAHEGGELIQSAALAISNKMTVDALAGQLFPYLTMVEGLKLCAQTFKKDVKELSCCAG